MFFLSRKDFPKENATSTFLLTLLFQVLFLESLRDFDIFFLGTAIFRYHNKILILRTNIKKLKQTLEIFEAIKA
jgi:hypothetical protein